MSFCVPKGVYYILIMKPINFFLSIALIAVHAGFGVIADGLERKEMKRVVDAHVHGEATMKIVIEGPLLEIELSSPAANFLGFEHTAHTPEELKKVNEAQRLLSQTDLIIRLSESSCIHSKTNIDQTNLLKSTDDHHGHDHDHDHKSNENEHSDISITYEYKCERPPTEMLVTLFDYFPAVQRLEAMWVSETRQGREILSSGQRVIEF